VNDGSHLHHRNCGGGLHSLVVQLIKWSEKSDKFQVRHRKGSKSQRGDVVEIAKNLVVDADSIEVTRGQGRVKHDCTLGIPQQPGNSLLNRDENRPSDHGEIVGVERNEGHFKLVLTCWKHSARGRTEMIFSVDILCAACI